MLIAKGLKAIENEKLKIENIETKNEELTYTDLEPKEAKDLIDTSTNLIVIDVSPHYDAGHLPGAIHYYLADGSLDAAIPDLDKEATYLVYCHHGMRSLKAAQLLRRHGLRATSMKGGIDTWAEKVDPSMQRY